MATTDAKTGFRLPWSGDRTETGDPTDAPTLDAPVEDVVSTDQENETPEMIDAVPATPDHVAAVESAVAPPEPTPAAVTASVAPASGRKPNKFMADLTKAMQAAAESARTDTLERFAAEAKVHVESIHASSATEASDLRKQADDDVAGIRDWSKQEIARIREETDERIAHRKTKLEGEIETHAATIEHRIELVQARVAQFEAEMAAFFEKLVAEDDPTRFAAMAESLPEPPPFDNEAWSDAALDAAMPKVDAPVEIEAAVEAPAPEIEEPTAVAEAPADAVQTDDASDAESTEATAETMDVPEPAAEAPTEEPGWPPAGSTPEMIGEAPEADLFSIGNDEAAAPDPRLDALGLTPDFAAAEAEAAAFTDVEAGADEEIPTIADDALAARLAGLVPDANDGASERMTTTVVVVGLVSVASIAGFKRQLGRVTGVHSVGVSSGPDGEFVFAVAHDPSVVLRDAVTNLSGFGARVTAETDDTLQVTARDPESEG